MDFLEKLASKTYALKQANKTFRCPTHGEYDFQANSYLLGYFIDSNDPYYHHIPPAVRDYCESSDHNAHTGPYRAYVVVICASLEKKIIEITDQMIETMKARIAACSQCLNQNRET